MSMNPATVTLKEWQGKGLELFGNDRQNWEFVCPMCNNIASVAIAEKKYPELKGRDWSPLSECVGRYTDKVKCDWCAYGLFQGPLFVKVDEDEKDSTIPIFDFRGKPFTKRTK